MSAVAPIIDWISDNAAAVIALCALGLAIYQAFSTRRHNRLSVRPRLFVVPNRALSPGIGTFSVTLRNGGLGPALISGFEVLLDKKPASLDDRNIATALIGTVVGKPLSRFQYHLLSPASVVAKDEQLVLLEIAFPAASTQDYETVLAALERLAVRIRYSSMYGENFECSTESPHEQSAK